MPTENRSSNTEQMVSVPRELAESIANPRNGFALGDSREQLRALLAQPAAQHQGEPILIQAVAVTRADADEGLRLEWLLEGGIAEMEFPGQVLFALPTANDLCDEDGSAEIFLHPPSSGGFSAGDMADQGAKAFAARDPEVKALRSALQFYADRDHFSEDMGGDWDNVSGEPANILWHESEAWFVEDGSIARAALSGSAVPPVEYGPTPGCKQCEEAEACGLTDCPECDAQLSEDVNGNGVRPDA